MALSKAFRVAALPGLMQVLTTGALCALGIVSCKDEQATVKREAPPPPPSATAATATVCATGGGTIGEPETAAEFPRSHAGYCVDPEGETRVYGEKAKYSMDEVCTTAFDGECEIYKRFSLKRVVTFRYLDGAGKGGTVEIIVSSFADANGAYGMFTKRVTAGMDPADAKYARPIAAGGAGALGSGRAYLWKGNQVVELTYLNELETPAQMIQSGDVVLPALMKEIGAKMAGSPALPPAAAALPKANLLPNGIEFFPKEPAPMIPLTVGASGSYKDGNARYRVLAFPRGSEAEAKAALNVFRSKPGALPVKDPVALGADEAVTVVLQEGASRPKCEYTAARKGTLVLAIGDEDRVMKSDAPLESQSALRLANEAKWKVIQSQFAASVAVPAASGAFKK